ncbi:MAG TPA: hypothetical protein VFR32_07180 [Gaiellaceae bacterium]|nr:hypothetical protein [Gaiellaceae bacterium]
MIARLVSAAAVFLMAVPLASATHEAFPGKAGKLVFQSNRDGNYELYVANANGSGVRKLLSRPQTDEFNANWSPSGTLLVFQTGPKDGSNFDIWLVKGDGKGAKPLVAGATNDRAPQFCDESTVVFTRGISQTNSEVFAVGANGKGVRRLTTHPASDSFPTCNPKGTRIAFISSRDGTPRIYEMTRTGTGLRPLTDPGALDPDYSSDGKAIAYVALDADRNLEVFAKNLQTGKVVQRTNVKPPFEYRLPKFVPEAATRLTSARADDVDDIVATNRNTQTSAEGLHRVGSQPPEIVPNGSGGAPQPLGPCECAKLDARILKDARRTPVVREGRAVQDVKVRVSWALRCGPGTGGCSASVRLTPDSGFRFDEAFTSPKEFDENEVTVSCKGPCGKTKIGTRQVKLNGELEKDFTLQLTARVRCASQSYFQVFKLFFQPNGRLDREDSDLNGNGRPDGKEK